MVCLPTSIANDGEPLFVASLISLLLFVTKKFWRGWFCISIQLVDNFYMQWAVLQPILVKHSGSGAPAEPLALFPLTHSYLTASAGGHARGSNLLTQLRTGLTAMATFLAIAWWDLGAILSFPSWVFESDRLVFNKCFDPFLVDMLHVCSCGQISFFFFLYSFEVVGYSCIVSMYYNLYIPNLFCLNICCTSRHHSQIPCVCHLNCSNAKLLLRVMYASLVWKSSRAFNVMYSLLRH
jgi:hypothetical protein